MGANKTFNCSDSSVLRDGVHRSCSWVSFYQVERFLFCGIYF